jgi:MFS family permease
MLLYAPVSAFADMWGTVFLKKLYNIDNSCASFINNILYIGMAVGAPFMARLSDRFQSRKRLLYIGLLGTFIAFAYTTFAPLPMSMTIVALFLVGVFVNGKVIAFTAALESVPRSLSGSVSGFVNMMCMLSGVVLQPLLGKIITMVWNGKIENGCPIYGIEDYRKSFLIVSCCLVLALCTLPKIKETFPKTVSSPL